ncbi:MAG: transporter [Ramlibacter sp.]|nr:transporter [Ramlibacter sp.]
MTMRNRVRLTALIAALPFAALAQDAAGWPTRPVRLIVPFAPGGATDAMARMLAQRMTLVWKQPVIVDNKPGAGTVIGTDAVAKAAPDGYTLGLVVSAHTINPSLRSKLPYDTLKDFAPVTQIGVQHMVIAANPSFPANNMAELIALAKKEPGKISYATSGAGTALHLGTELLKSKAGIDIVHVAYKGGAPAQQDVIGGQVPLLLDIYFSTSQFIKSGKLKAIAMLSPQRAAAAPNIPTVAETVPGVSALSTMGIIAPAATPRGIVAKASADLVKVIRSPEFSEHLQAIGVDPVGSTPEEYDSMIRADIAKWAPVVKASGASAD